MEIVNNIKQLYQNWQPYKHWEQGQRLSEAKNQALRNKNVPSADELNSAKHYGHTLINSIDIMDQESINKSKDAAIIVQEILGVFILLPPIIGALAGYLKSGKNISGIKKVKNIFYGLFIANFLQQLVVGIFSSTVDKEATRVARYHTRENKLKDVRNFVIYNDKQIDDAKQIAETMPEIKENELSYKESLNVKKSYKQAWKNFSDLKNDYKKYKQWKENYLKEDKINKINREKLSFNENEISQAQIDRDKILLTMKKLEIASNDYEINIGFLLESGLILGSLLASTLAFSGFLLLDKVSRKVKVAQNGKFLKFAKILSVPMPLIGFSLFAMLFAKLQKDAVKIGRQKEKNNLENNPKEFIVYDEKTKKQVQNVTIDSQKKDNKEGLNNKLSNIKKDFKEYYDYKSKIRPNELKLREALKKIKVSNEQMKDAGNLQKQMFYSFEKIDEKSTSFVEDTNAAVSIGFFAVQTAVVLACKLMQVKILGNRLEKLKNGANAKGFINTLKLLPKLKPKDVFYIVLLLPLINTTTQIIFSYLKSKIVKRACRVGVMTAMKDLEDPKIYVNTPKTNRPLAQES